MSGSGNLLNNNGSEISANTLYTTPTVNKLPDKWELEPKSRELFERGRPGQGYCGIAVIHKDNIKIYLRPAFNHNDGLARIDTNNCRYQPDETVQGTHQFGSTGVGVIHTVMRQSLEKFLYPNDKLKDISLGFGLLKGGDNTPPDQFNIIYLKSNSCGLANNINSLYAKNSNALPELQPFQNKSIILLDTQVQNKKTIFIIQHGEFIRCPGLKNENSIALSEQEIEDLNQGNTNNLTTRLSIVEKSLKVFGLDSPIRELRNKSASLNSNSIIYDANFLNFVQFINKKDATPDGIDKGDKFNLWRSIPIGIMRNLTTALFKGLNLSEDLLSVHLEKSWDNEQYEKCWEKYSRLSAQEMIDAHIKNIQLEISIILKTLKIHTDILCNNGLFGNIFDNKAQATVYIEKKALPELRAMIDHLNILIKDLNSQEKEEIKNRILDKTLSDELTQASNYNDDRNPYITGLDYLFPNPKKNLHDFFSNLLESKPAQPSEVNKPGC